MAKYLSNRVRTFDIGITSITESDVVLNVIGNTTFTGDVSLGDNNVLSFGDGSDLRIIHIANQNWIQNNTGDFNIQQNDDDSDITFRSDDGSGGITEYINIDGSTGEVVLYHYGSQKFATKSTGIDVTGLTETDTLNVSGTSTFNDSVDIEGVNSILDVKEGTIYTTEVQGNNRELYLRGGGSQSTRPTIHLPNTTNPLSILGNSSNTQGIVIDSRSTGAVDIKHNSSTKLQTTASGIDVTGLTETDTLNVSGDTTFQGNVNLGDNNELRFGAGNDFKIYHDPDDARLENVNGDVKFKNTGSYFFFDEDGGETLASLINDGAVNLYHAGDKKFETTSTGINVTGNDIKLLGPTSGSTFTSSTLTLRGYRQGNGGIFGSLDFNNIDANSANTEYVGARIDASTPGANGGELKFFVTPNQFTTLNTTPTLTLHEDGVAEFTGAIELGDDDELRLGDDNDLKLWHNGFNSIINDEGVGDLYLGGNSSVNITNGALSEFKAKFITDGAVELYYDNVKKFETTSTGIHVDANTSLGGTAGNSQDIAIFETGNGNQSKLKIVETRFSSGSNWTTAYTRIQKQIDSSNMGYIQFNGSGLNYGVEIGNATDGEKYATFARNAAATLYHNGVGKFNTSSTGANVIGTLLATSLSTGASGTGINISTDTITGPSTLTLDPAAIGDNTGTVVIAGNLQIDGTTTTVNSTTMTVDDKNLELGTGAANDAAADGGGITIVSGDGNKTFQFEATGDNLGSSENLNLANTKEYKINNTSVLSATTLGSGVTASSLTSVGTLNGLTVDGDLSISDKITHLSDTNTTIRFPANDTIRFETSGSPRLDVSPNGYILVGTTSEPSGGDAHAQNAKLLVQGRIGNAADSGRINLQRGSSTSNNSSIGSISFTDVSNNAFSRIETFADATPGSSSFPGRITFSTTNDGASTPTEKLRITSGGQVSIGADLSQATDAKLTVEGSAALTNLNQTLVVRDSSTNDAVGNGGFVGLAGFVNNVPRTLAGIRGLKSSAGSSFNGDLAFYTRQNAIANLDEKLRITSDGSVGIGTDDPTALLHAQNNSVSDTKIIIESTGTNSYPAFRVKNDARTYDLGIDGATDAFRIYDVIGTSERLRINSDGKVGVGITDPECKLQVNGDLQVGDSNVAGTFINVVGAGVNQLFGVRFGSGSNNPESKFSILGSTSHNDMTIRFTSSGTERFRFKSDGKFGVGTDNPLGTVHISSGTSGDATLVLEADTDNDNDADNPYILFRQDGGINASAIGHGLDSGVNANGLTIANSINSGFISFATGSSTGYTNASERLRITSAGDVGIGTDNPVTKLQVAGNLTVGPLNTTDQYQGILIVNGKDSSSAETISFVDGRNDLGTVDSNIWMAHETNGGSYIRFDTTPAGNRNTDRRVERLRINSAGNVGIGTDNPSTKLEIAGTGSPTVKISDSDGTNQFGQILANNGTFVVESRNDTSTGQIIFRGRDGSGTVEYGRFDSNGDLGIGIDDPQERLHVSSVVLVTGETPQIRLNSSATDASDNDRSMLGQATAANNFVSTSATGDTILRGTSTGNLLFGIGTSEKLRIGSSGQIGLGGANYGTSGQVLTSNGSSSAPTWQNATASVSAADESGDTTCFPLFAIDDSGPVTLKTDASGLTYNSADEILSATTFSGSTLVSTVSTGTAPLTVTSTTLVSNLNADLLDGQQGSFYLNTGTTFGGDVSGTYNNIAITNDSHTHQFNNLTSKDLGTGFYSTSGNLESGRGSGGVALTINDGYGNANVTFNHRSGTPEQNGKAGRIVVNTDATTGDATMNFQLGDATANTQAGINQILSLSSGTSVFDGTSGLTFNNRPAFNGGTSGSTAPFTVDSTFVVTNLNADLLDGEGGTFYTNASNIDAGTLAIARGGTNGSATPTAGGAAYGTGTAYAFTAAGTSGQVLTSNGASAPTWQDVSLSADDESTDATCFPLFATTDSGPITLKTDASGLTYDSDNERLQSTDVAVKGAVRVENSGSTERFEILYNETTDSLDFTYSAS